MQQLSLFSPASELTPQEAYSQLLSIKTFNWELLLKAAETLEKGFKKDNYKVIGCPDTADFFNTLPKVANAGYLIAAKAVWWHRIVFLDLPIGSFSADEFKTNPFFKVFRVVKFDTRYKRFKTNKHLIPLARANYNLVKNKSSKYLLDNLGEQAEHFISCKKDEEILALKDEIEALTKQVNKLRQGILNHNGYDCKNFELPQKYIDLYTLSKSTNMSAIQTSVFMDIMMLDGFYPACRYLDKFDLPYSA